MNTVRKIAFVIGFAFPMYGYAVLGKQWFDLCTQVFIMTILALLLEFVIKSKDSTYVAMIVSAMGTVLYAMAKQVLKVGTVYVWTDEVMWWLVPFVFVLILIIDLVKTLKNAAK